MSKGVSQFRFIKCEKMPKADEHKYPNSYINLRELSNIQSGETLVMFPSGDVPNL